MSDESEIRAGIEAAAQESASLVSQNNYLRALQVAVSAPSGSKDQSLRDLAASSVSTVLNHIKEADINKILEEMTEDERTATMKYVYRAMSLGQNCTKLLQWHEKLYEKDGVGIVMRTLVDRKING